MFGSSIGSSLGRNLRGLSSYSTSRPASGASSDNKSGSSSSGGTRGTVSIERHTVLLRLRETFTDREAHEFGP